MSVADANVAASVHARLLNRARASGRPFNELLQYYVMERVLARLSRSPERDRFVLKGALMLPLWGGPAIRSTRDIDLLGRGDPSVDGLVRRFRALLCAPIDEVDGLAFDPDEIRGQATRLAAHYDGVRLRCVAHLGSARVTVQVDVGFGDVVTPAVQPVSYPTLLGHPAPDLLGYTPETAVAEKVQAMVVLDAANTRLKDFYDVWMLANKRTFDGGLLASAVTATFARRATTVPPAPPHAFTEAFAVRADKQAQWRAFVRKARVQGEVPSLDAVVEQIAAFVLPVLSAVAAEATFVLMWGPGGPWRAPG